MDLTDSYIIYFLLLLIVLCYGASYKRCIVSKNKARLIPLFIFLLAYCFIEGCRYYVGTDWENYRDLYNSILSTGIKWNLLLDFSGYEPGYILLNFLCVIPRLSYQYLFALVACIEIVLYFSAFRKSPQIIILSAFVFGTGYMITSQNIARQFLSIAIFLPFCLMLSEGKYYKYILGCVIAFFTHFSSVIAIPFVFINSKIFKFLENRLFGIIVFTISFFLGTIFSGLIIDYLPLMTDNTKYIDNLQSLAVVHEYSSGLGLLFQIFTNILAILWYDKYKTIVSINLSTMFRIFIIGVVLHNAFANSMFLARLPLILYSTRYFLIPTMYYWMLKHNDYKRILAISMIVVTLIGFIMTINSGAAGCSPFKLSF